MPTFNAQTYLVEAIESILKQSHQDLELLIVDGGSHDLTESIVSSFIERDPRVRWHLRRGTTPVQRFNEFLAACRHDYFFLSHSDDVQHSARIAAQIRYMESHKSVVMCGTDTFFWLHDHKSSFGTSYSGIAEYPHHYHEIHAQLLFWWCFANPSLAFRAEFFRQSGLKMDEKFKYCADYLFYWEIAGRAAVANVPEVLLAYRHHSASEGPANRPALSSEVARVKQQILESAGLVKILGPVLTDVFLRLGIERNVVIDCPDQLDEYDKLFATIDSHFTGEIQAETRKLTALYRAQILEKKFPARVSLPRRIVRKIRRIYVNEFS